MEPTVSEETRTKGRSFVAFVLGRMAQSPGFGAALRRADNPATEYQAWEHLAPWCDLGNDHQRLPLATVAAALARAQPNGDGNVPLGAAIARCYEDGHQSDAARARLRRLVACTTVQEVCQVLRPVLSLVASKGVPLDHGALLDELWWFHPERTRLRWAEQFYGRREEP